MSKNITGTEYPLCKIFSTDFHFEIPPYQRPYAWIKENARELFDDLKDFYHDEKEESYFLGSIVLIKQEDNPHAQVIDGQQRLTTLTILISALTSLIDDKEAREECFYYIQEPGKRLQGIPAKPRLTLRQRDREFFATTIQSLEFDKLAKLDSVTLENESQVNIQQNAGLLRDKLKETFTTTEALINFGIFLMTRCFMVVVASPSQQSAFRVFSILNNRGMNLLPSDLIKADVIGNITETERNKFNDKWENIEVNTGRTGLNDLLTYIRMIYAKNKAKRSLLKEFPEYVQSKHPDSKNLINDVIAPYAEAYLIARDANYQSSTNAKDINALFYWLNKIDNSDWLPVAILFLAKFGTNSDAVLDFMFRLERLAAKLHLCGANINERIERYGKILTELENATSYHIDSVNLSAIEAKEFCEKLDDEVYCFNARQRSYLILRLDSFISDKAAKYDHAVLTIEHVLPQTVDKDSEWQKNWPDEEQRMYWTHRLANLVPLTQRRNSLASNFDFERKKKAYFVGKNGVTSYVLTTQVLNETKWTPAILKQRQQDLVGICIKNWKLEANTQ